MQFADFDFSVLCLILWKCVRAPCLEYSACLKKVNLTIALVTFQFIKSTIPIFLGISMCVRIVQSVP